MSPADRIRMLEIMGLVIRLTADHERLDVFGPWIVLNAAEPTLRKHRDALLVHLRSLEGATISDSTTREDSNVPLEPVVSSLVTGT